MCAHALTVTERCLCLIKLTGLGRCSGIYFFNNGWLMLRETVQKKKKKVSYKMFIHFKSLKGDHFFFLFVCFASYQKSFPCQ